MRANADPMELDAVEVGSMQIMGIAVDHSLMR
jgi:hypothetical protein